MDVDALDELREAATPGPWAQHSLDKAYVLGQYVSEDEYLDVADTDHYMRSSSRTAFADAALIVAAVNNLPALLPAVRERDALRAAALEMVDAWRADDEQERNDLGERVWAAVRGLARIVNGGGQR